MNHDVGNEHKTVFLGIDSACDCQIWLPDHVGDQETEKKDSRGNQREWLVLWKWSWSTTSTLNSQGSKSIVSLMLTVTKMRNTNCRFEVDLTSVVEILFFLALGGSTEGEYSVRSLRSKRNGRGGREEGARQAVSLGHCGCREPWALWLHQAEEYAYHPYAGLARGATRSIKSDLQIQEVMPTT